MRLKFLIGEVLTGFRKNITIAIAMILTSAIALTMLGTGILVVNLTDRSKQQFLSELEIRVNLSKSFTNADPKCEQADCKALEEKIKGTPGVASIRYLSQDEVYDDAIHRVFADQPDLQELAAQHGKEALLAYFKVTASDQKTFGQLVEKFRDDPELKGKVQNVVDQRELVKRVFRVFDGARDVAFAMAVITAVIAVFLIANMVQIAAFTRRNEIAIMRLVGATRWYTQLPFLVEAVIASLFGSTLAVVGLFVSRKVFFQNSLQDFQLAGLIAPVTTGDVWQLAPFITLIGAVLAASTAYVTLRWYVRS
ncbi:MAG: permease-like cell division protein FtsX [Segniliparus sp.]|uniref:permease-like cell division protein FtsX n=1 Tax=Segniliparus sp. TaxID=2804064 RepID=UPI003F3A290B